MVKEVMIIEQDLINAGYKSDSSFVQVGNYEDEDNLYFWVKGDVVVFKRSYHSTYFEKCQRDEINYHTGFPRYAEVITDKSQL